MDILSKLWPTRLYTRFSLSILLWFPFGLLAIVFRLFIGYGLISLHNRIGRDVCHLNIEHSFLKVLITFIKLSPRFMEYKLYYTRAGQTSRVFLFDNEFRIKSL